jgi:hypothetical protein
MHEVHHAMVYKNMSLLERDPKLLPKKRAEEIKAAANLLDEDITWFKGKFDKDGKLLPAEFAKLSTIGSGKNAVNQELKAELEHLYQIVDKAQNKMTARMEFMAHILHSENPIVTAWAATVRRKVQSNRTLFGRVLTAMRMLLGLGENQTSLLQDLYAYTDTFAETATEKRVQDTTVENFDTGLSINDPEGGTENVDPVQASNAYYERAQNVLRALQIIEESGCLAG